MDNNNTNILDQPLFEQSREHILQSNHFEWEKQYLKIFSSQLLFQRDKLIEQFQNTMKTSFPDYKIDYFIQYLKKDRKESIQFDDEEMKILENNKDFHSLLIHFHKSVGILLEIDFQKKNDKDLINYFKQVDLNMQGFLYCLLEDLLKNSQWKDKLDMLKKEANKDDDILSLQIGKNVYEKCQKSKNTKKYFTILIIGAVGTGKSKLAQELLQELNGNKIDTQFIDGNKIDGVTKNLNRQQIDYGNVVIDIIDTPGCGDIESGLELVFKQLTDKSEEINLILFCMNAQILRLLRQDICFLSIIQGIFSCNWEIFFICLNFMEQVNKEQIQCDQIINSFEKIFEIKIPQENLLIEKDPKHKIQKIKENINQLIQSQNQNSFKLQRYFPKIKFIQKRLDQYKM